VSAALGRDVLERFRNGDWQGLALRLDGLRERMARFKLDILGKTREQKMAYGNELLKERDALAECKTKLLDVLDKPYLEMSKILSEIRHRQFQEKDPPLHRSDVELCERAEQDYRGWDELKSEAAQWMVLLEQAELKIDDCLIEDHLRSDFRVLDKDVAPTDTHRRARFKP
jgi:hypothetical protein